MTVRTRMPRQERHSQLLDLGADLFATRPYEDVQIEQIAELAGVSRGLMYHYFPTKRAFFAELVRRESAKILAETTPDPTLPLIEQLRHGVDAYLRHCKANQKGVQAIYRGSASADPDVRAIIERATEEQTRRILAVAAPSDDPHPLLEIAVRSWLQFLRSACYESLQRDTDMAQREIGDLAIGALVGALTALPANARPPAMAELIATAAP